MTAWHTGPLLGWDLETTAPDPTEARIVTSTCVAVHGVAEPRVRDWLVDPGIDISDEAAAIHGITTEQAREHGQDPATACKEIADALYAQWSLGLPVVAFNAAYDCTVLDRELRRHHGVGLDVRGPVIDPHVLDKHLDRYRKGGRTLAATAEHYSVRLEGAHSSSGDAIAACRVAWRLATVYESLADLETLNERQAGWRAEQAASLQTYFRRNGDPDAIVRPEWPILPVEATV